MQVRDGWQEVKPIHWKPCMYVCTQFLRHISIHVKSLLQLWLLEQRQDCVLFLDNAQLPYLEAYNALSWLCYKYFTHIDMVVL